MLTLERTEEPLKQVFESNFKQIILEDLKIVNIFQDSYCFCQRKDLEKIHGFLRFDSSKFCLFL